MNHLQQLLDEKFPWPTNGDVMEEITANRLRGAFVSGIYAVLREVLKIIPKEDSSGRKGCYYGDTKYDSESVVYGFNMGLDEVMTKYAALSNTVSELKMEPKTTTND